MIESDELGASIPDLIGLRIAVLHSLDRHQDDTSLLTAFDAGRVSIPMSGYAEEYAAVAAQFRGRTDEVDRRLETPLLLARRFDSPYFASISLMCLGTILRDRSQVEPGWIDPENLAVLIDAAIVAIEPPPEPR